MRPTFFIVIVVLFTLFLAIVVAALSHHKRAGSGELKLIGAIAEVDSRLDPDGTVIIGGELWRARSKDGNVISPHTRVRIVGFKDLLALVEIYDSVSDSL